MRFNSWRKPALLVAVFGVILLVGVGCLLRPTLTPSSTPTTSRTGLPPEFDILKEAWQTLSENSVYKGSLDTRKLSQGAVRGMMEALGDPHGAFLDPEFYRMQEEDLKGSFEGIGARVTSQGDWVVILAPLPGTPAERAGLRPGDVIISVDDRSTLGMSLYEVVAIIRGPRGTTVSLGIIREGEGEPLTVKVTRELIDVPSVTLKMLSNGVAYLALGEFSHDTDAELLPALDKMDQEGARGVLLDLRNNLGGVLPAVVQVASHFLEEGLVLYEVDSDGARKEWPVEKVKKRTNIPMVVLVNRFTASGAEVLAGALRDHQRAVLVGENTYGKGSVNNLYPLSDGSAIYLTVARWYTPGGTLIEGKGLEPDFPVAPSPDGKGDPQMEKALELLRERMGGS